MHVIVELLLREERRSINVMHFVILQCCEKLIELYRWIFNHAPIMYRSKE